MDESDDLYSAADCLPHRSEPGPSKHPSASGKSGSDSRSTINGEPQDGVAGTSSSLTTGDSALQKTAPNSNSASLLTTTNGHMAIPYTDDHPELVDYDVKHQCVAVHHTLLQPLQTPCGHRICTPCFDDILEGITSVPCPAKEESCVILSKENVYPDFGERRELSRLDVYCMFRHLGCLEILILKELKNHIDKCSFRPLPCKYKDFGCKTTLTKDTYNNHVKKCNHEPMRCRQCSIEVPKCDMQDHISNECSKGKTRCPNNCGESSIPRDRLTDHLANCPSTPRSCDFHLSGCEFKGSAEALTSHYRTEAERHAKLSQDSLQKRDREIKSVSQELSASKDTIEKLKTDVRKQTSEMEKLRSVSFNQEQKIRDMTKMLAKQGLEINKLEENSKHLASKEQLARHEAELTTLKTKVVSQESTVAGLGSRTTGNIPDAIWGRMTTYERQMAIQQVRLAEADLRFHCLENTNYNGVLFWKVDEYTRKKGEAVSGQTLSLYSQPFFTNRYGYKMCARVYLNGDGQGRGSHLSVFFVIMRGEFDALLKWPFRQKVTLTLVDQSGRRHISDTFRPDPSSSSFKKPEMEMNIASGCPLFAAHSIVEKAPFMKDDTIFIKVSVDTSDLEI